MDNATGDVCTNCNDAEVYARGMCRRCYQYWMRTGKQHPGYHGKLSPDDVLEIAIDYRQGVPVSSLAKTYGVSMPTVYRALRGGAACYEKAREKVAQVFSLEHLDARLRYGKRFARRALTPQAVRRLREAHARGVSVQILAEHVGMTRQAIDAIVKGQHYAEVGGPVVSGR